jgi:hypothetical protein
MLTPEHRLASARVLKGHRLFSQMISTVGDGISHVSTSNAHDPMATLIAYLQQQHGIGGGQSGAAVSDHPREQVVEKTHDRQEAEPTAREKAGGQDAEVSTEAYFRTVRFHVPGFHTEARRDIIDNGRAASGKQSTSQSGQDQLVRKVQDHSCILQDQLVRKAGRTSSCIPLTTNIVHSYYPKIFRDKQRGYFVDLAANHATFISNSFTLERDLGWNGLCIEVGVGRCM